MANENSLALTQTDISVPSAWCRALILPLKALKHGSLTLTDGQWQQSFGQQGGIEAEIQILNRSFYRAVIQGGSIGAAESYMDGDWESPNLVAVIELMAANIELLDSIERKTSWLSRLLLKILHKKNSNTLAGSKKNIEAHYDLSNSFYQLFLDRSMMYSSAVYTDKHQTLAQASEYKLKKLCDSLELKADDHLLEIGTGWGGLACYAAQHYGCKVTTTTISEAQYQFARQRVQQLGLEDKVTLLKQDYRHLKGQYDKLISIEMIEAVGYEHLPQFFKQCSKLLKPTGKMALQAITISCQREAIYRKSVDFIQKYIFPGGYLPSLSVLTRTMAQHSELAIRELSDIGPHYARTLYDWRENFEASRDKVKSLGFDDRFIRMWRYYLCYCEGGFRQKTISTVQLVLEKGANH